MLVLGLSNMRDAAAALVSDGRIVAAAEEERFVRQKHVTALPVLAIRYCLREAGMTLRDVDAIAVPWKYWQVGRRARLAVTAMLRSPQLFRVKGARSLERVSREWMELFRLRRELTQRVRTSVIGPFFSIIISATRPVRFLMSPFERRPYWSWTALQKRTPPCSRWAKATESPCWTAPRSRIRSASSMRP